MTGQQAAIRDTLAVARAMLSWGYPLTSREIALWGGLDPTMVANRLRAGSEIAARVHGQPSLFKRDPVTRCWELTEAGRMWVENQT